jgi:hypothetical protein
MGTLTAKSEVATPSGYFMRRHKLTFTIYLFAHTIPSAVFYSTVATIDCLSEMLVYELQVFSLDFLLPNSVGLRVPL